MGPMERNKILFQYGELLLKLHGGALPLEHLQFFFEAFQANYREMLPNDSVAGHAVFTAMTSTSVDEENVDSNTFEKVAETPVVVRMKKIDDENTNSNTFEKVAETPVVIRVKKIVK
eukprot:561911-Rhodomonas_salina.2